MGWRHMANVDPHTFSSKPAVGAHCPAKHGMSIMLWRPLKRRFSEHRASDFSAYTQSTVPVVESAVPLFEGDYDGLQDEPTVTFSPDQQGDVSHTARLSQSIVDGLGGDFGLLRETMHIASFSTVIGHYHTCILQSAARYLELVMARPDDRGNNRIRVEWETCLVWLLPTVLLRTAPRFDKCILLPIHKVRPSGALPRSESNQHLRIARLAVTMGYTRCQ